MALDEVLHTPVLPRMDCVTTLGLCLMLTVDHGSSELFWDLVGTARQGGSDQ